MENDDLLLEFLAESTEHLAQLETQLLALEVQGALFDVELVNELFRGLHSIKGAAAFLGLTRIAELSHEMESVLNSIRQGQLEVDKQVVDQLLAGSDQLSALVSELGRSHDRTREGTSRDTLPGTPSVAGIEATDWGVSQAAATVRVSAGALDHLLDLAGELIVGRNQLLQALGDQQDARLEAAGARIDELTGELRAAVMKTRMQPIGSLFSRYPRVLRELSAALGKQVVLLTEGDEVELDTAVLEVIGDSLTHLLRNSVDHGIETPEVRAAKGSPAHGTVRLRAHHDGGAVTVTLTDDGAGVDVAALKAKALSIGLISEQRARELDDHEAHQLIFHPGFTTKDVVTDISGRGVGMDVVQTRLEELGGTIEVESELGRGTTIALKLPTTVSILPALIVRSPDESYAIPRLNVVEQLVVEAGAADVPIEDLDGREHLRLRGRSLALVRLDELQAGAGQERTNVVVVAAGKLRYGLVVGQLCDSEEIVVRPLGRQIGGARCFSGTTVLEDGQVALILDIAGIASFQGLESTRSGGEAA